jgi:hypothetical protein
MPRSLLSSDPRRVAVVAVGALCAAVALPTAALALAAPASGSLSAELELSTSSTWYGGGQFVVRNGTDAPRDWTLSFTVPHGTFTNDASWATDAEVHGDHVVVTPKSPLTPGATAHVAFGIQGDGTAGLAPEACDVDGAAVTSCAPGSGDGGGDPAPGEDVEKPSTVTDLTTDFSHDDRVHVMWAHAVDDVGVDRYELERDGEHLMYVEGSRRMLDVPGHEPGATYEYRVRALDAAGNEGDWSAASSVTLPGAPVDDTSAPTAPGGLRAADVTASTASVSWDASRDDVGVAGYTAVLEGDGTRVERRTDGTSTTFTGLRPGRGYTVSVVARDAPGNESDAAVVDVTTADEAPALPGAGTPADVAAAADSYQDGTLTMHRIRLSWTPRDGAFRRYEILLDGERVQTLLVGDQESAAVQQGRQTRYLALGPGTPAAGHTVQVRAQLPDGSWSEPTAPVTVR